MQKELHCQIITRFLMGERIEHMKVVHVGTIYLKLLMRMLDQDGQGIISSIADPDLFDTLISRRSYKEPFSYERLTDILQESSGSHFDPKLNVLFDELVRCYFTV